LGLRGCPDLSPQSDFAVRVDIWDDTGDSIVEHVAGVDDFEVAEATYRAAVALRMAAIVSSVTCSSRKPMPTTVSRPRF
jgi:hypothetical protein